MKRLIISVLLLIVAISVDAQELNPVKWQFSIKNISKGLFELHMTAAIDEPWKVYAQNTPPGGPFPTSFSFNKNPMLVMQGKIKEVGEMHKKNEEAFGVEVFYYKEKVDFVQLIKLRTAVKTSVSGKVVFMTCNDTQCLQPKEVKFKVDLK